MDKVKCTQYACLNNTGLSKGKINYGNEELCTLENPKRTNYSEHIWGCADERYGNEIKEGESDE